MYGNPHVLAGKKAGANLINLQKPWQRIRAAANLSDVRIHDLRHSFASIAAGAGMSLPMIGRLLGHSLPATTARYAHLSADPVRAASNLVGNEISAAMTPGLRITSFAAQQRSPETQQHVLDGPEPSKSFRHNNNQLRSASERQ